MNRTYSININGRIYTINDDAFALLQDYLNQLNATFPGTEGIEIVADIESRVADHFDEALARDHRLVVTIADVRTVIETMGRPEEFAEYAGAGSPSPEPASQPAAPAPRKRIYRSTTDKWFGGVFGGLAAYLGWDVTIMRMLYIALALFTGLWPATLVYLLAWMIIPQANTPRRILEMQGQPVTVGNVGQTVLETTPPPYPGSTTSTNDTNGTLANIARVAAKAVMGVLGFFSAIGAITCTICFATVLTGLLLFEFGNSSILLDSFDIDHLSVAWGCMFGCLIAIIPLIAIAWAACSVIFGTKGASKATFITAVVLEVLFIAALVIGEAVIPNLGRNITYFCLSECDVQSYANAAAVYCVSRIAI